MPQNQEQLSNIPQDTDKEKLQAEEVKVGMGAEMKPAGLSDETKRELFDNLKTALMVNKDLSDEQVFDIAIEMTEGRGVLADNQVASAKQFLAGQFEQLTERAKQRSIDRQKKLEQQMAEDHEQELQTPYYWEQRIKQIIEQESNAAPIEEITQKIATGDPSTLAIFPFGDRAIFSRPIEGRNHVGDEMITEAVIIDLYTGGEKVIARYDREIMAFSISHDQQRIALVVGGIERNKQENRIVDWFYRHRIKVISLKDGQEIEVAEITKKPYHEGNLYAHGNFVTRIRGSFIFPGHRFDRYDNFYFSNNDHKVVLKSLHEDRYIIIPIAEAGADLLVRADEADDHPDIPLEAKVNWDKDFTEERKRALGPPIRGRYLAERYWGGKSPPKMIEPEIIEPVGAHLNDPNELMIYLNSQLARLIPKPRSELGMVISDATRKIKGLQAGVIDVRIRQMCQSFIDAVNSWWQGRKNLPRPAGQPVPGTQTLPRPASQPTQGTETLPRPSDEPA